MKLVLRSVVVVVVLVYVDRKVDRWSLLIG